MIKEDEEKKITPWESGVIRGKANPLPNSEPWTSGVTRGKANPIVMEDSSETSGTLICVDVQPEYQKHISFNLYNFGNMINNHNDRVVFLYNGYDTLGMINESKYKIWLMDECGIEKDVIDKSIFYDKGYAFFRYCLDSGIDEDKIVGLIKMMIEHNINDSRDLDNEFWNNYVNKFGDDELKELLEFADDCINIPDLMDFLKQFSNISLCGGGQYECLKEVEIALMALDKDYNRIDRYIYEENKQLKEVLKRIKQIIIY